MSCLHDRVVEAAPPFLEPSAKGLNGPQCVWALFKELRVSYDVFMTTPMQ